MLESLFNLLALAGVIAQSADERRVRAVGEIIGIADRLYRAGSLTVTKLQQLTNMVKAMVEEEREPTADEWAAMRARSDDAHDRIQDVDLSDPDGTDEATDPADDPTASEAADGDGAVGGDNGGSDPAAADTGESGPVSDDSGDPPTGSVDNPADNPDAEPVT